MSGRLTGRVALIAGDVGGAGRIQAVRSAEEGADLVLLTHRESDEPWGVPSLSNTAVAETVQRVRSLGRRVITLEADVLDEIALDAALAEGVSALERLDIVYVTVAGDSMDGVVDVDADDSGGTDHTGVGRARTTLDLPPEVWQKMLDVTLTATWKTVKAAIPHLRHRHGEGGAIVLTSPGVDRAVIGGTLVMVEHGIIGLVRTLAVELAPDHVRVNAVTTSTASQEDIADVGLFLASEESRSLTGVVLPSRRNLSHRDTPVHPAPR